MIDDETHPVPLKADGGRYTETLLYDFSKYLTSLALLILGGVLALLPSLDAAEMKLSNVALVLGLVSMGGAMALSTAHAIVDARVKEREPPRHLRRGLYGAVALLGLGTGAFLMLWWDALN